MNQLEVITPSKAAYNGAVKSVTVPGTMGNFQILSNHAPIISSLEIGEVKVIEENGNVIDFSTSGGTVEVSNNKIIILAESFEDVNEIDVKRAEKAKTRAEERIAKRKTEKIDDFRAELALMRAINRLKSRKKHI
ncbi:MAG: F0F1 ATP synthase subunit epsilon [Ignavibacteriae bacterium]|nr:F0F1 ATP synthase subunit epsilon [Ignavibacteriota bacterium]